MSENPFITLREVFRISEKQWAAAPESELIWHQHINLLFSTPLTSTVEGRDAALRTRLFENIVVGFFGFSDNSCSRPKETTGNITYNNNSQGL